MRHRRLGRVLGRSPSHRKSLFRNLIKALILTEDPDAGDPKDKKGAPFVKGRIITTISKAKEVRPMVERVVTIAKKAYIAQQLANPLASTAKRGSLEWQEWRKGEGWRKWANAMAPVVNARRRVAAILGETGDPHSKGDKKSLRILFDHIAPRFVERPGGYTRVVRLAKPRLGDAGVRAVLEFVGVRDRAEKAKTKAVAPAFDAPAAEAPKTEAAT